MCKYDSVHLTIDFDSFLVQGERATGYGVALLTTLFGSYCEQPLLQSIAPDVDIKNESVAKKLKKN